MLRVINDENKFEITLDVHNYRPEELKVSSLSYGTCTTYPACGEIK